MKSCFCTFLILCLALVSCEPICLSKEEQLNTAEEVIGANSQNIIDNKYDGGNDVGWVIENIQYDCMKTSMIARAKITFKGQYSGLSYWARGTFKIDLARETWEFKEESIDPMLKIALGIGEDAKKELLNSFQGTDSKESDSLLTDSSQGN